MELRETRRELWDPGTSPARWFDSGIVQVSWDIHTICIDLFQMYQNHCAMHSKVLIACGRALLANQTAKLGRYPASPAAQPRVVSWSSNAKPIGHFQVWIGSWILSTVLLCQLADIVLIVRLQVTIKQKHVLCPEKRWFCSWNRLTEKPMLPFWLMSDAIWKNQVHSRILHSALSACGHDDIAQGKAGKIQFAHVWSNPIHDTQIVRPSCCKSWEGQHHLGGAGFNGNNVPKITVTKFNNGNQATMGRCCCWPLPGRALGRCYWVPPKS